MAKQAKQVEKELPDSAVKNSVKEVLAHYENIESARGKFMHAARREREGMQGVYEGLAARGVSQRAAKTEIKIIRAIQRIKGWVEDLEAEDRRMVQKLAKAQGDKKQLSLLLDVPVPKAKRDDKVVELHTNGGDQPAA